MRKILSATNRWSPAGGCDWSAWVGKAKAAATGRRIGPLLKESPHPNDRQKSVKGSRILVLGVAYKKDVDDLRESPTLKIMQLLGEHGARIEYITFAICAARLSAVA